MVLVLDTDDEDERKLFASVQDLGPNREQPVGDAFRAPKPHFPLPRLKGQRSRVLAADKEMALKADRFRLSLEWS
ncbi:MAG: hypothetical protein DME88_06780 [Verrucomicrobia bacterium]|nr:MAG: hypothetical protein DME88_06780 [Verrucomicrobiota bacterium]